MSPRRLRALVVDDEPLARRLLRQMLAAHPDVEVVGEAASGRAALERLEDGGVDVLFLDVEMPGLSGVELLLQLTASATIPEPPMVVFVTAYDQYAVNAFELHALDYLLKPIDEDRLARAVRRARAEADRADRSGQTERILALLEQLQRRERQLDRIPIRVGERTFFQPVDEIEWIEADGKYVNVHVGQQTHVVRETLAQVGESLDPERFVRISRSAIVNVSRIREIQPWFRGEHVVLLQGGANVPSTRAYRENLDRLLRRRR